MGRRATMSGRTSRGLAVWRAKDRHARLAPQPAENVPRSRCACRSAMEIAGAAIVHRCVAALATKAPRLMADVVACIAVNQCGACAQNEADFLQHAPSRRPAYC